MMAQTSLLRIAAKNYLHQTKVLPD